ncbi:MAG: response regulator transcription factor [Lachnospiraceae bacterium]|nr:response regulator transcription factor [Lachnospiraceae bacterium]
MRLPAVLFFAILVKRYGDTMIKFAICDDEPFMVEELSARLAGYMSERALGSYRIDRFSNGSSLLENGGEFDLIFLDIQMQQPNGVETARILRQRNQCSFLIFVTVLRDYVFDAFEVQAYDYLLKPLDSDHFKRTMDRVMKALEQREGKSIVVRRGASCEVVWLSQILYCEVQGRKIYMHQIDGRITDYYERLGDLERRVDGRFFRCHRSYLVNLDFVRGCKEGRVMLPRGNEIPVSRLREQELMKVLLRYHFGRS